MNADPPVIWATEDRLLEPIAECRSSANHRVFRSDAYPKYYAGNGFILDDPLRLALSDWEKLFVSHFAGFFMHRNRARLQSVATAATHRRIGLASLVVSHVTRDALTELGTKIVAICADQNDIALELYRKLGGRDVGLQLGLLKYENHLHKDSSSKV